MWDVVAVHLPVRDPRRGGRPLKHGHRLVIDTILYVLVSGCAWRLAPHDLAPWDAAYRWFRLWSAAGVWDDIHTALRDAVRRAEGRDPAPTAAVLDSQTAKSASGGEQIGYDAGKRTRGRKRHLLVDTVGLLLICVVHSASVQDRAGAKLVLSWLDEQYPSIGLIWVDGGYVNVVDDSLVGWADRELAEDFIKIAMIHCASRRRCSPPYARKAKHGDHRPHSAAVATPRFADAILFATKTGAPYA
jgi:transposase